MTFPSTTPDFALTCSVDELDAQGFGRDDIECYVAWTRGTLGYTPDEEELRRFGQLATLVVVTDI